MFASLIAATLIAQAAPEPAWHWSDFFGQRVQIWGRQTANGSIQYQPTDAAMIAPVELERRKQADQGAVGSLNYGVLVDQMRADGRVIRASDPETLRMVTADAAARSPDGPDDVERKPGIIERAEMDVERIVLYGVVACLAAASLILVVKSSRPYPP